MSKGFFQEQQVNNKQNDQPWKKSERDAMLDAYFAGGNGAHPNVIARKLGRNSKAVKRRIEEYTYNEDDRVAHYEPFRRVSRKGQRWTQNELTLLKANRAKGVEAKHTARLLCRDVNELTLKKEAQVGKTKSLLSLAPTLDLIWAYRYVHVVYKQQLISDEVYDGLVQEEIEYGGGAAEFEAIKHHQGWPERIRSLGLYLVQREKEKE
jgi:hypothetical protein